MHARVPLPSHLGPYEVGAKIASGGMATVYLGRVTSKGDETIVALKVIKDELADQQAFIHMFLDEAKILSQLSHPNIIETREYGITGVHRFIAMELLLGRTLMDLWDVLAARGQRLPADLSAWIGARVTEGLHYAHELKDPSGMPLQVIHRDVNPSNIFLTYDGRVKLIDFGLAKAVGRRARSAAGIVKGKLPYLSPEQVTEDTIDRRTDLYALGTTLWEMGTGKRLFKRDNDVATVAAIRSAVIPDPRTIVDDFPDALWAIVKKALEPKRDVRHATALEMGRALDTFVATSERRIDASTLEALLADVFRGERGKQAAWLRQASIPDTREVAQTMPPPVPIGFSPPMVLSEAPLGLTPAAAATSEKAKTAAAVENEPSRALLLASRKSGCRVPSDFQPVALASLKRAEEESRRWLLVTYAMAAVLVIMAIISAR